MDLRTLTWDYPEPPGDELWRATRIAEFFPFVMSELSQEDRTLVLKYLDEIHLPCERKEFIRMVCGGKQGTD